MSFGPSPRQGERLALLEAMGRPAWLVDGTTRRVVAVNGDAQVLLGRTEDQLSGALADTLIASPEDQAFWDEAHAGRADPLCSDTFVSDAAGRSVPVTRRIHPVRVDGARGLFLVCVDDRSQACRQQEAGDTLAAQLQATLESTGDGILVTDLAGGIRGFNRRFAQLWAIPPDLLQQRDDAAVLAWVRRRTIDPDAFGCRFDALAASADESADERVVLHTGQELECSTRPQRSRGRTCGRVWAFRDRTELAEAGRRIEILSTTDALTGLVNRYRIGQTLDESILRAQRSGGSFALLILDLDRFRQINDSLGERAGDQVLIGVAERLRSTLHPGDLVARVGDDRFALLVHQADQHCAEAVARRVLGEVAHPFPMGALQFTLSCSVGVALHPADGDSAERLFRHAETAMQRAKLGGRGCVRFHQPHHDADLRLRMRLDQAMRQALACRRFRLKYQPQVDLRSGAVVGAEALVRWRDPELGDVEPTEFIAVAEDTGFIVELGHWVLTQAVRQAAAWRRSGLVMPVAVNVSALQFRQADFARQLERTLRDHDLPGALLELELTESLIGADAQTTLECLQEAAGLGVRLSIDDFGTGHSNLACLKRLALHRLKIDRRFVSGLPGDDSDAGIARAIVQMAHALGLRVIAEGVETAAQLDFLAQAGCDEYQGTLFAPALDALSFEERLRGREPPARRRLSLVRRA